MEPLKIAVTGEGSTDYGRRIYNEKQCRKEWREGPIFPIIRHTAEKLGRGAALEGIDKKEVLGIRLQRKNLSKVGTLEGKAKDSARFSWYLAMHGYSYGIFYCDTDKEAGEKNTDETVCRKLFERVYKEVRAGLEAAEIKDQTVVAMLPLKMIECWLLADPDAFQSCFGIKKPQLPPKPELIWGNKEDMLSNYPKNVMRRVLMLSDRPIECNQDTYCDLAEEISVETLRKKCGISFERFYQDFRSFVNSQNAEEKISAKC